MNQRFELVSIHNFCQARLDCSNSTSPQFLQFSACEMIKLAKNHQL